MSTHDASGTSVCIHAVCVDPAYRRRGIAVALLTEYVARLAQSGLYERALLITHEELRGLYEKAGFEWLGRSKVVHGSKPWYEMRKALATPAPPCSTAADSVEPPAESSLQSLPPNINIWEALQRATTSRAVPVATLLSAFPHGIDDTTQPADASSSALTNKHDLLCPRPQCGSIILKNQVATLVERPSTALEPSGARDPLLPPLPAPLSLVRCWRITPNAMAFENIGFSKSITAEGPSSCTRLVDTRVDGPLFVRWKTAETAIVRGMRPRAPWLVSGRRERVLACD